MLVSVNTAGASSAKIAASNGSMQITITGTWSGGNVKLQKRASDGSTYQTIYTFTADECVTVDVVRDSVYQFYSTGTLNLTCEVAVESGQIV